MCSFCATINQAQSTSLDEMYRDLVRSNNAGYLPTYIKNRNAPEFLIDHEQLIKAQENKDIYPEDAEDVEVNFDDKRLVRERIEKAKILLWQQTLQAVKDNRVTPVELKEIKDRVAEDQLATLGLNVRRYSDAHTRSSRLSREARLESRSFSHQRGQN